MIKLHDIEGIKVWLMMLILVIVVASLRVDEHTHIIIRF